MKNSSALQKDLQAAPSSFTPSQKQQSVMNKERKSTSATKTPEERKFQEDLERAIEESKRSSSHRMISEHLVSYSEDTRKFEEQLQRAMAESIDTYHHGKKKAFEQRDYDGEAMEIEDEFSYETENKNIYEDYKNMIYEGDVFIRQDRMNENSMFPLKEEHLADSYLTLEKNLNKKRG